MLTPVDVDVAYQYLRQKCDAAPEAVLILGSGIPRPAATTRREIPYADIPYLKTTSVAGHRGTLVFAEVGRTPVLICDGRLHLFEGHDPSVAALPLRLAARLGCRAAVITGAAGSLREGFSPGDVVVLTDHINLLPASPLAGPAYEEFGPRFVAPADAYDEDLRRRARAAAQKQGFALKEAVYAAVPGPAYETAAEARALALLGGDVVGMSVVNDVLVARQQRMRVLSLCAVVNVAGAPHTDHDAVLRNASEPGRRIAALAAALLADRAYVGDNAL